MRLRAVFGRANRICDQIDNALQQDDAHRRCRDMRFLLLPTRFPSPETMGQGDITVWTKWIHEETDVVMHQLEEELEARGDPDDPFNSTANGVFQSLQENLLSLPPPVQTPRRQDNTSKHSKPSRELPRTNQTLEKSNVNMKTNRGENQTQVTLCKFSEHSLESLDPMRSIQNLHTQQLQNRLQEVSNQNEVPEGLNTSLNITQRNTSPQGSDLITFTPPPGQNAGVQHGSGR